MSDEDNAEAWTTLSVRTSTRDRFNNERPDSVGSADEFLDLLLDTYDGEIDYETEAIVRRLEDVEDVVMASNIRREEVREALEGLREVVESSGTGVGYDDVVAASRQALREELPGEALQG